MTAFPQAVLPGLDAEVRPPPLKTPEALAALDGKRRLRPRNHEQCLVAEWFVKVCGELRQYAPDDKTGHWPSREDYEQWLRREGAHSVLCEIVDAIDWGET